MMQNPDRVAFTLFGRDIYWYGVLMAVGIVIAVLLAMRESNRKKLPKDTIIDLCLIIIPCGIVGARLYYVLLELDNYLADPIRMLYVWEGGLAIYGAVIGGLIGMYFYGRKKKIKFLTLADCIAPGLVLAQAIGRWGNFFNQEAFGNPVTDSSLLWFPLSVRIDGYHTYEGYVNGQYVTGACSNPYHLATFFYESMWCLLIFLLLWFVLRKRAKHNGDIFLSYVMLYGFERMFVEGLRGDSLWLIRPEHVAWIPGGIRISQLLSAVMFLAVLVFFIVRALKERKAGKLLWPGAYVPPADSAAVADAEAEDNGCSCMGCEGKDCPSCGERADDVEDEAPAEADAEEAIIEEAAEKSTAAENTDGEKPDGE